MQRVLDHPPGSIQGALVGLLEARFATFVELTAGSPNAAELYDVHDRICGDIARRAQKRALALVTRLLDRAGREGTLSLRASGLTARQAADVLLECAHAAKGEDPATATPAAYRARLDRLVRLVIHGLAPAG